MQHSWSCLRAADANPRAVPACTGGSVASLGVPIYKISRGARARLRKNVIFEEAKWTCH